MDYSLKKRFISRLVLTSALLTLPSAALAEPPTPINTEMTDPVMLRYQYRPGSSERFNVAMETSATISDRVSSSEVSTVTRGSAVLRVAVQSLDAEGNGILYQEFGGVALEFLEGGDDVSTRSSARALEGLVRQVKANVKGEILDEQLTGSDEVLAVRTELILLRESWDWFRFQMPEIEVGMGDTWERQYSIDLSQDGDLETTATLDATYTYLGYSTVGGSEYAMVRGDLELWIEVPNEVYLFGMDGPALGRGTGLAYYYFDTNLGRIEQGTIDFGMVMQGDSGSSPFDYLGTSTITYGQGSQQAPE